MIPAPEKKTTAGINDDGGEQQQRRENPAHGIRFINVGNDLVGINQIIDGNEIKGRLKLVPENPRSGFFKQSEKNKQSEKRTGDGTVNASVDAGGREKQQVKDIENDHKQKRHQSGEQQNAQSLNQRQRAQVKYPEIIDQLQQQIQPLRYDRYHKNGISRRTGKVFIYILLSDFYFFEKSKLFFGFWQYKSKVIPVLF